MKKFFSVLFSIIIFILLITLSINLSIEKLVIDTINDSVVKKEVSDFVTDAIYQEYPEISVDDLDSLEGLYENRVYGIQENNNIDDFPSNEFTQEVKTANQLSALTLEKDLSLEQINWLQEHIGNIYEIEDGLRNFAAGINRITEPIISLDDYFNKLYNMLKGE